ncbi:hypothetical protein EVAR_84655_1 [Eumeta japonica]|uniref:Uncharacterized protein n=1 Tax=Eumeta variegata TaxID=151549 RepID=A0A4C1UYH9_EUMVA|nr:hypothetical protein EVAR_84655_1 [Eumeta japonica]
MSFHNLLISDLSARSSSLAYCGSQAANDLYRYCDDNIPPRQLNVLPKAQRQCGPPAPDGRVAKTKSIPRSRSRLPRPRFREAPRRLGGARAAVSLQCYCPLFVSRRFYPHPRPPIRSLKVTVLRRSPGAPAHIVGELARHALHAAFSRAGIAPRACRPNAEALGESLSMGLSLSFVTCTRRIAL